MTIFLVASGFLLILAISASEDREHMQPLAVALRRVVRIGPAMWVMLLAVMVVASIDATDDAADVVRHALNLGYGGNQKSATTGDRARPRLRRPAPR